MPITHINARSGGLMASNSASSQMVSEFSTLRPRRLSSTRINRFTLTTSRAIRNTRVIQWPES